MNFYVKKDGEQRGPFDRAKLQGRIDAGEFNVLDLGFDGLNDGWKSLESFGFKTIQKPPELPPPLEDQNHLEPAKRRYHLQDNPIPEGYKILIERVDVKGVENYAAAAIGFINGENQSLQLAHEPANKFDKNAVMVIGSWWEHGERQGGKLGYLPRKCAEYLVSSPHAKYVAPRLWKTFISESFYIEIGIQLLSPKVIPKAPERGIIKAIRGWLKK